MDTRKAGMPEIQSIKSWYVQGIHRLKVTSRERNLAVIREHVINSL